MSFLSTTINNFILWRYLPVNFVHIYAKNKFLFIFFIAEKPAFVRTLFRLRHEALYVLDVESCRVNFFSGFYISFFFVTVEQCFKFLNLNYLFNDYIGLVLFKNHFLNCSFSFLNQMLFKQIAFSDYLISLWHILWIGVILPIFYFLGYVLSNYFYINVNKNN